MQLTWVEREDLQKREYAMFEEKTANAINRRFYKGKCIIKMRAGVINRILIKIPDYDDFVEIKYYLGESCVIIVGVCYNHFGIDVSRTKKQYFIYGNIPVTNNIIITEKLDNIINASTNADFLNKHKDLNYLTTIIEYWHKYMKLLTTTHYLAHLDRAYTLLLIHKYNRVFPLDVLKIIIAKLF